MSSVKIHPCLVCGNMTRNRITCSKECSSQRFAKALVKCVQCSNIIPKNFENKKFCNRSCATSYNNKGIIRNPNGLGGFKTDNRGLGNNGGGRKVEPNYCKECNIRIKTRSVYCSNKCFNTYRYKEKIKAWHEDSTIANNKYGQVPAFLRKYLISEAGYKCTEISCTSTDFEGVILEIDHIDGKADNNSPENLRVVCPQCHALSPFHRALNKNSSRVNRKKNLVTS